MRAIYRGHHRRLKNTAVPQLLHDFFATVSTGSTVGIQGTSQLAAKVSHMNWKSAVFHYPNNTELPVCHVVRHVISQ
jgi:hypothetical protein